MPISPSPSPLHLREQMKMARTHIQTPHDPPNAAPDAMMTRPEPIAASSLTELTSLADAPPTSRPDPNVSYNRKGLLLWIVRVADSNDLILTTLHPARGSSSATASEIAGSLYYLHLHTSPSAATPVPRATLIRRHPGSGEQRNVAEFVCVDGNADRVAIEMLNMGYERLAGGGGGGGAVAGRSPLRVASVRRKPVPVPGLQGPMFTRVMQVEGEGFWERVKGFKHRRAGSPRTPQQHQDESPGLSNRGPREKKKKRDYVFQCPWGTDATCEFKDEAAGKYLKCKYYTKTEEQSTLMSIIEFKPSALGGGGHHKRSASAGDAAAAEKDTKQKAKLGMLIIHGPGQEMLDLLVAANMAAFLKRWEAWGKEKFAIGGW